MAKKDNPNRTETFEAQLKAFSRATNAYQKAAVACAMTALEHFEDCGQLGLCQRFYEELRGNRKIHNPAAFALWLGTYAPVKMNGKKFIKDKGENANPFDLEGAAKMPYYEMGKDNDEVPDFTATQFLARIKAQIAKYLDDTKQHPKDAPAIAVVRMMEKKVEEIERVLEAPNNNLGGEADAEVQLLKAKDVKAA